MTLQQRLEQTIQRHTQARANVESLESQLAGWKQEVIGLQAQIQLLQTMLAEQSAEQVAVERAAVSPEQTDTPAPLPLRA